MIRLNEGDLSVGKNVCCENTDVDMKYGDVHFSAAQVSGKTDIYTKEGDVMAAGLRVAGNMQIRTGCGDISAVGVKITGNMKIRSGEGNVCVMTDKKNCRLLRVAASTKYGDMRIAGGKRKRKGIGWVYKKSGSGKPGLQIATKYGDVLLFRKNT